MIGQSTPSDAALAAQFGGKPISQTTPDSELAAKYGGKPIATPQPEEEQQPVTIPEGEKGFVNQVKATGKNFINLPGNVWDAITKPAQDDNELNAAQLLQQAVTQSGGYIPTPVALALHRMVIAPMVKEQTTADAYRKVAEAHPEKENFYDGPTHMANMHQIAAFVPMLGPMAADITEHYLQGDKSGAVGAILSNIAAAKATEGAMKVAGEGIGKIKPTAANVGGTEVPAISPTLPAKAAEQVARVGAGGRKILSNFADTQAQAAEQAVGGVAREAATPAAEVIDKGAPPTASFPEGVAKTSRFTSEEWKNLKAVDELKKAQSFGDAAKVLKDAAQEHFSALDKATNGEFQKLTNERSAISKQIRKDPSLSYEKQQELFKRMDAISDEEDSLFDQYGIPKDNQTALGKARQIYKQGSAMDELDTRINKALSRGTEKGAEPLKDVQGRSFNLPEQQLQGNKLYDAVNNMKPNRLLEAVGGNEAHVKALKDLGLLMQQTRNLSRASYLLKTVEGIVGYKTGGLSEVASPIMAKILTSPKATSAFVNGIKANAGSFLVAQSIGKALQEKSNEQ